MTHRLPIILLFLLMLVLRTASAQQRESATQVVTFGVKLTNVAQRTMQTGITGGERTQVDLRKGSVVTSAYQHTVNSRTVSVTGFQEKAAQRRQTPPQQSFPGVRVVTITD
jgi:hypothetical protein